MDANDTKKGVMFNPVHTFHIGVWFAASRGAANAGSSKTVTPFDGDHEAGIQALSTRNFPALKGPVGTIK